jgi:hypothetical protein
MVMMLQIFLDEIEGAENDPALLIFFFPSVLGLDAMPPHPCCSIFLFFSV